MRGTIQGADLSVVLTRPGAVGGAPIELATVCAGREEEGEGSVKERETVKWAKAGR